MEFFNQFIKKYPINKEEDARLLSPVVLAYVGDAVFELFVRIYLISTGETKASELQKKSILYVKAKSQADIYKNISEKLTEEEHEIIRRGRNVKPNSPPKNADVMDYRYATGFEALIGYLYLSNNHERLLEVIEASIECVNY